MQNENGFYTICSEDRKTGLKSVNQPSSKQSEFDKTTGSDKKKRKKKNRLARKGAGNRPKPEPDIINHNPLDCCPECQTDLTTQPIVEIANRIVEDIPPIPEKTIISQEVQERKWCSCCNKVVSSVSEAALPSSDIGLRSLCFIAYLWVVSAISLPGIAALLNNFCRLRLSTAALSRMMIRLGKLMIPMYEEILEDVKGGSF